jgi:hypothetical protein
LQLVLDLGLIGRRFRLRVYVPRSEQEG